MAEVIVVGAGPTGLMLAGDLAAAGVAVTVLERRDKDSNLTRAFAVHARTLETLDARDLADELVATGEKLPRVRLLGRLQIDLSQLPSRYPYLLVTPQYQTERLLTERAHKYGVEFAGGTEVLAIHQDPDGVTVHTRQSGPHRAAYVVGTDGVHSTVREALNLPFPGRSAVRSVMLGDVRLTDAPAEALTVNAVGDALSLLAPFGDGWYRVIAWSRQDQQPDDAPVDLEQIRTVVVKCFGTDYGMHEARWLSRFHSDERQTPTYRVGRVLLAGDAAHAHSPAGGQGMNTGLTDVANLSWKLAATVRGEAPDGLLDSYQSERHPIGGQVLKLSGGILRLGMLRPWQLPVAHTVLGVALRNKAVGRRAALRVSGIGLRYPAPAGAHKLVGARVPDVRLTDGRLYEALRDGRFLLVGSGTVPGVRTVRPTVDGLPTMLVRPDGYIAWASDTPTDAAAQAAAATWIASS